MPETDDEQPNPDCERDMSVLRSHVAQLSEHFETVQIFVSRRAPDGAEGTIGAQLGDGNWFARYGQVPEWVVKQEAISRREATADDDSE